MITSPMWIPIRTRTCESAGHVASASATCPSIAPRIADEGSAKVTDIASPSRCMAVPPCAAKASRSTRRCSARSVRYSAPRDLRRFVEPSMSVKGRARASVGSATGAPLLGSDEAANHVDQALELGRGRRQLVGEVMAGLRQRPPREVHLVRGLGVLEVGLETEQLHPDGGVLDPEDLRRERLVQA